MINSVFCLPTVPSQCVLVNELTKPNTYSTIVTNICDQMQVKLGAELWRVRAPVDAPVSSNSIDVCFTYAQMSTIGTVANMSVKK